VRAFDVVVVGNVGVDTVAYLPEGGIDLEVESNFTENVDCVGQAGGYAARGYAQLGKKTAFIGYVGDDHNGRYIREEFAGDGINADAMFIDPAGTGRSINLMYKDGTRTNFYDGKGHMELEPRLEHCMSIMAAAEFAHFSIPNWARNLLSPAKELGLTIACDIQDVLSASDDYRLDFIDHADILFFSGTNQDDPVSMISEFITRKPGMIVVVGLGAKGCALGTNQGVEFFPPVEMDSPVVDTNGAGDSLAVGFLAGYLLDGYSLEDSILRGQIAARHACTLRGSSSDLITAGRLASFFDDLKTTP
jgi:sugar/nucleoside kinase (ribokinase family)